MRGRVAIRFDPPAPEGTLICRNVRHATNGGYNLNSDSKAYIPGHLSICISVNKDVSALLARFYTEVYLYEVIDRNLVRILPEDTTYQKLFLISTFVNYYNLASISTLNSIKEM